MLADAAQVGPARRDDPPGLRPGPAGPHGDRQRSRRHHHRRPAQRVDPAAVPEELRATLIAALSIPLSLVISFVFLYLTGDTLNLMSLGGLAVAIGLIIDDTVVVIENIPRGTYNCGNSASSAACRRCAHAG